MGKCELCGKIIRKQYLKKCIKCEREKICIECYHKKDKLCIDCMSITYNEKYNERIKAYEKNNLSAGSFIN